MNGAEIDSLGGFSITYGVIGDLTTPDERGGYSGNASLLYVSGFLRDPQLSHLC